MVRVINSTRGVIAAVVSALFVSSAVVILSAMLGGHLVALQTAEAEAPTSSTGMTVNREGKSDALPIASVVDASIGYRARGGNSFFQTDPVANVTIVPKNLDLPEVTIRVPEKTKVEPEPAESAGPAALPQGCESAFARPAPEALTRISSRCVT